MSPSFVCVSTVICCTPLFAQEFGHLRGRDLGCDFCLGAEPTYCCLGLLVSKIFTKTKWRERGTEWKSRIQLNQQPEPEGAKQGD